MVELYPEIRFVHVTAALASGALFLVRGLSLFAGAPWALSAPLRYCAYSIDTVLLTAALMLTVIVRQYPFVHGWLSAKVGLLVVYIALGMFAFWRGRNRNARLAAWLAALGVFGFIYSVARAHHPLGFLAGVLANA